MNQRPAVLLLDDGELDDIQEMLSGENISYARVRGSAILRETPPPTKLLVATPRRMESVREVEANGEGEPAFTRVVVVDGDSSSLRDQLRRVGFDYLVRRPVHPEALRLMLLHCVYTGEERRSEPRVPVGFEISFRAGILYRKATLVDLSMGGCRLLSNFSLEPGKRIKLQLPEALGVSKGLAIPGRVLRMSFDERLGKQGLYATAIQFENVPKAVRRELESILQERLQGPPTLPDERPREERAADAEEEDWFTELADARRQRLKGGIVEIAGAAQHDPRSPDYSPGQPAPALPAEPAHPATAAAEPHESEAAPAPPIPSIEVDVRLAPEADHGWAPSAETADEALCMPEAATAERDEDDFEDDDADTQPWARPLLPELDTEPASEDPDADTAPDRAESSRETEPAAHAEPAPANPFAPPETATIADSHEGEDLTGDGSERRRNPRADFPRKVPAFGSRAMRVLMGRDISQGGMRVARVPELELGDRLHLAIYGEPDEEPFLVWATVMRDDGTEGFGLIFDPVHEVTATKLDQIVGDLPAVESLKEGEAAAMGTVVSEILDS